jgi:ABC-type multidrug transport system ATPase subunit
MGPEKPTINYPNSFNNNDDNKTIFHEEGGIHASRILSRGDFGENDGNAVCIDEAFAEYDSVRRTFTEQSRNNSRIQQTSDIEKGQATEDFDLTEYLSDQHTQIAAAGLKPKNMGVIWKSLSVQGLGADARSILTNWSVIQQTLQFWNWGKKKGTDVTILYDNNGFVKSGEMLLVLGCPGAGTSTLLRVLANIRASFTGVFGEVSYGGIDAEEFSKYFKGEVCYNEEEDLHYPTLTTEQTLRFALKNKTPSTRLPGESKTDFIESLLYMLGNMLGLTKQMNTMVGDAFIRGLSGGERKRLSIAEQMTTHSSINCWDCATRGLDASSALDYVRSLRIMTDIMKKTTISTLYQASDSMYDLFDKVMILDEGRCIYFGPADEAKPYFIDLGFYCPSRKSTPDFLTGLCNLNEREVRSDFQGPVPMDAAQFEITYKESPLYTRMLHERDAYEKQIVQDQPSLDFREAFKQAHKKPFVINYFEQVKSLAVRQYQLILGDKKSLYLRYSDVIIKGLITSSIFYMMPLDGSGAFSRGGAFIFIVFFNSFVAQSELPAFMEGRRILEKHKHFALFHPSAFYLAQVIIDFPLSVLQAVLFQLCSYFMMGLAMDAGKVSPYRILLNLI